MIVEPGGCSAAVAELTEGEGLSNRQAADVLGVSPQTVGRDRVPNGTPPPEPETPPLYNAPVTRLGWWLYGFFVGALLVLAAVTWGWVVADVWG